MAQLELSGEIVGVLAMRKSEGFIGSTYRAPLPSGWERTAETTEG